MSRYTFNRSIEPGGGNRNRRVALGAIAAGVVLCAGVGLFAAGLSALTGGGLLGQAATPTPFTPKVVIYGEGGQPITPAAPTAVAQPATVPAKPSAAPTSAPTPGGTAAQPTPAPKPSAAPAMDPLGALPGLPDFVCPGPRSATNKLGYGIKGNVLEGDIGFWNSVVAEKLKLTWIGAKINWYEFEPAKDKIENFRWQLLDAFVADANKKGLNIAMTVTQPPQWARSVQDKPGARPSPADDINENVRFFSRVAARYRGCVQAIEVFNEVNLDRDWRLPSGQLRAADYVRYLQPVSQALKRIDPNLIVVMAALSPTGANVPGAAQDDFAYMDDFVATGGLNSVDCVGVHLNGFNFPPDKEWNAGYNDPTAKFRGPFDGPHHSWSFLSTIKTYRQKTNKPLCVTEFGWPSMENLGVQGAPPGFDFALDNTEKEQADWIVQAFTIMRELGYVRFGVVFNLDYIVKTSAQPNQDNALPYSIVRRDGAPRPAFDALERMPKP